jgi:hypothetical protein
MQSKDKLENKIRYYNKKQHVVNNILELIKDYDSPIR